MLKYKLKTNDLFYIGWILMVCHLCVANSNAIKYSTNIISIISLSLFIIKIFLTLKYTEKQLLIMLLLSIGSIASYVPNHDMRVIWFAVVILAAKGIEFDTTVKYSFITMMICCITFVILFKIGLTEQNVIVMRRGTRYGIGLGHPNMASAYFTLLLIQYIYIKFERIKKSSFLLMFIFTTIVYRITKSNTGVIVSIGIILITLAIKYLPYKRFNVKMICLILGILILFFTLAPIFYTTQLSAIDSAMSGRLHQANYYYTKYGISLFGNDLQELSWSNTDWLLDIGFIRMLLNNGLFYYTLVVINYIVWIRISVGEEKYKLLCLISGFLLYMCAENPATYIFMNVSMLLFSKSVYSIRKVNNKKYI